MKIGQKKILGVPEKNPSSYYVDIGLSSGITFRQATEKARGNSCMIAGMIR